MKLKLLILPAAMLLSTLTQAAIAPGADLAPWKAYATIGVFHSSGIVVVDSTQAKCVQRFKDAIDNHFENNGPQFEHIQKCHYNPARAAIAFDGKLVSDLKTLDEIYSIEEYQLRKVQLLNAHETEKRESASVR